MLNSLRSTKLLRKVNYLVELPPICWNDKELAWDVLSTTADSLSFSVHLGNSGGSLSHAKHKCMSEGYFKV